MNAVARERALWYTADRANIQKRPFVHWEQAGLLASVLFPVFVRQGAGFSIEGFWVAVRDDLVQEMGLPRILLTIAQYESVGVETLAAIAVDAEGTASVDRAPVVRAFHIHRTATVARECYEPVEEVGPVAKTVERSFQVRVVVEREDS